MFDHSSFPKGVVLAVATLTLVVNPLLFAEDDPVGPNVQVNYDDGPDGLAVQPACCIEVPIPETGCDTSLCCFLRGPFCVGGANDGDPCIDDSDCETGGGYCNACDDEPKHHQEPTIVVAPWDSDLLLAAFNDNAVGFEDAVDSRGLGFALSRDGGLTWERFDRDEIGDPCDPDPCTVDSDCFVEGHAFNRGDLCDEDLPSGWPTYPA